MEFGAVQKLINAGAQIDSVGENPGCNTALQQASAKGSVEIVKLLLDAGARVDLQKSPRFSQNSALQAAVANGHPDVVRFLIERKADRNARGGYDHAGLLHTAAAYRRKEVLELLIEHEVKIIDPENEDGDTLRLACLWGAPEVVQLLLKYGANVNAASSSGTTALITTTLCVHRNSAMRWGNQQEQKAIMRLLISYGADVNAVGQGWGGSALHGAVQWMDEDALETLFNSGADVNVQGGLFGNPLQAIAVKSKYENNLVKLATKAKYRKALEAAGFKPRALSVVKSLIERGADVNAEGMFHIM